MENRESSLGWNENQHGNTNGKYFLKRSLSCSGDKQIQETMVNVVLFSYQRLLATGVGRCLDLTNQRSFVLKNWLDLLFLAYLSVNPELHHSALRLSLKVFMFPVISGFVFFDGGSRGKRWKLVQSIVLQHKRIGHKKANLPCNLNIVKMKKSTIVLVILSVLKRFEKL